jgi:calcineurin-like phosphoesterase family protein
MHEYLIDSHNSVVKSSDKFYDLGDLTMIQHGNTLISALKKLVASRNGYQSIILGNHDRLKPVHYSEMFKKVRGSMRIDNLIFSHIPIHPSSIKRGCVNVHGHIHTQPVYLGPYINISVEAIDYTPVSLDELKSQAKKLLRKLDNA